MKRMARGILTGRCESRSGWLENSGVMEQTQGQVNVFSKVKEHPLRVIPYRRYYGRVANRATRDRIKENLRSRARENAIGVPDREMFYICPWRRSARAHRQMINHPAIQQHLMNEACQPTQFSGNRIRPARSLARGFIPCEPLRRGPSMAVPDMEILTIILRADLRGNLTGNISIGVRFDQMMPGIGGKPIKPSCKAVKIDI